MNRGLGRPAQFLIKSVVERCALFEQAVNKLLATFADFSYSGTIELFSELMQRPQRLGLGFSRECEGAVENSVQKL